MSIKRKVTAIFIAINLLSLGILPVHANNRDRQLKVMTYNMYLGSDFEDIFTATEPEQVLLEVGEAYRDMLAGNVPERISAIADQIESGEPDLVGLQEVALWQTGQFLNSDPATDVTYDFLQMLLDELSERGLNYRAIATQANLDVELPGIVSPESFLDIRYTDRDVILARAERRTSEFKLLGTQSENFAAALSLPIFGQTVTIVRGWASADVKFRGKTYRFINTHLESIYEPIQLAQANELLTGPAATRLPVILVGDFNSDAEAGGTAYLMLTGAGLADTWDSQNPNDPGHTWALSGEIPSNILAPTQRLDYILARGRVTTSAVDILGEVAADMTPSGFRPSDHAGVSAAFVIQP